MVMAAFSTILKPLQLPITMFVNVNSNLWVTGATASTDETNTLAIKTTTKQPIVSHLNQRDMENLLLVYPKRAFSHSRVFPCSIQCVGCYRVYATCCGGQIEANCG